VVRVATYRRRSLDSSTATAFSEQPSAATTASSALPRGTLIRARLDIPADPNVPGPVTATVIQDVSNGTNTIVPKGSTLLCSTRGTAARRLSIVCDGANVNARTLAMNGTVLGADQRPGVPVSVTAGTSSAAEPARNGGLDAAAQVARVVAPGGPLVGAVAGIAIDSARATTDRATRPTEAQFLPVPKGTVFLVFVNSFGGA
jgi:hypothetical protein